MPFKEAVKSSFATAQGWKRNAKWGVILGVIGVGVNALTGRYKQEPQVAPAPMVAEPAPASVMEQAPQTGKFAAKETARREETAQQEAQVG